MRENAVVGMAGAVLVLAVLASAQGKDAAGRALFDGKTTTGWRGYKAKEMPAGWKIVDGALTKDGKTVDIITTDQFGDFDLEFEWKIAPGGNAGIFYRGTEEHDHVYWSAPEYQLLDDAAAKDGQSRLTAAGSAYALYPAPAGIVKPAGEWNTGRIVAKGAHVEHWLNGQKLLEYEMWSPDHAILNGPAAGLSPWRPGRGRPQPSPGRA
jgi:hypothetical protein